MPHRKVNRLDALFKPRSIAVIGASNQEDAHSNSILKNLIGSDFQGIVYPVNPSIKSIRGVKAYRKVQDIGEVIDLAIIDAEVQELPSIFKDCSEAKVKSAMILSGGFRLAKENGDALYQEILTQAKASKITILGASSFGFINPRMNLNASLFNGQVLKGHTAFISQSRSICSAILNWAAAENVGFSTFVSVGSMMDIQFHELIDYFGMDMHTRNILIYMESLAEARRFMSAARAFARSKPILILKAGQTETGANIIYQHTANQAGNDAIFSALFRRAGVIKVDTIEHLFDCAEALSMQPRPKSNRLAIVTNAGAPAVLAVDYLIKNGGQLAQLSPLTLEALNKILPNNRFNGNPVDVLANSSIERYKQAVKICLKDENVDGVLAILTSQTKSDVKGIAQEITKINNDTSKTLLASCVGELTRRELSQILMDGNIPTYCFPESAVYSFLKMYEYKKNIDLLYETPSRIPQDFEPHEAEGKTLIQTVYQDQRTYLNPDESRRLLGFYGIPMVASNLVKNLEEGLLLANQMGYPIVLKLNIGEKVSKSKTGTIALNIESEALFLRSWDTIVSNGHANIPNYSFKGVFVEKMVKKQYELSVSSIKTADTGPVISFGMGGIAVEVFNDLNYGIPPLNMALANRIIENTKIYKLLKGYGSLPSVDLDAIRFLLIKFSYLLMDFPEIQQISLNPFVVDEAGGVVLDADIWLDNLQKNYKPYQHLIVSPYPQGYTKNIILKNGQAALLRPIKPEDEPLEKALIEKFSEKTTFLRFFTTSFELTHEFLTKFTNIDYDREMAIVAEVEENGERMLAGVVRIIGDAEYFAAEYAIAIADPWQGLGLGAHLTSFILEIGQQMGFQRIEATLLRQNMGMKTIFIKYGFTVEPVDFETLYAYLDLNTLDESTNLREA